MSVSPALAGQAPLYKLSCLHPWQSIPSPIEGIVRLSVAKIVAYFSSPVARFFGGRKFFCWCAIGGPPASQSRRSALPWHRPGCLGGPGCLGQGTGPAKRPGASPALGKLPFIPSRFQWTGRPQGISFSGGRTKTPGTPRTPKTGQMLGAKRCQYTRQLQARSATHGPANRRCEALSMHRPGCLGCPGCPGQGAGPAKRPSAYLGHRQVAIHFQPLPVGGPPARSAASCGRAARKEFHFPAGGPGHPRQGKQNACAPGTRASTDWDSRLPGGGIPGHRHANPRRSALL